MAELKRALKTAKKLLGEGRSEDAISCLQVCYCLICYFVKLSHLAPSEVISVAMYLVFPKL